MPMPTIGVAQVLNARHAEHARAGAQFVEPERRVLADRFAHYPVTGDDDDGTVTLRCQTSQGSTGKQHLVIWMGVEGDNRSHGTDSCG